MRTMGRKTQFIVLAVIFLLDAVQSKEQLEYNYNAYIISRNKASAEGFAKWTISGKLTIQSLENHKIFKLDDLKTSVFNGKINTKEPELKDPLEDVKYISSPFAVHFNTLDDIKITIEKNEPSWSANMKKAIASIFHINAESQDDTKNIEQTIYGNCEVSYKRNSQNQKEEIYKTINHNNCTEFSNTNWKNVKEIILKNNHKKNQITTRRFYQFTKNGDKTGKLEYVRTYSNFVYQNMPATRATHNVEQNAEFHLINSSGIFSPLEISDDLEQVSIIYEKSHEDEKKQEQSEIINEYKTALTSFKKDFKKLPIENANIKDFTKLGEMYTALSKIDRKGIALLTLSVALGGDSEDIYMLVSLLPYVGTDTTVALIEELVKNDDLNDLILMKLLITFPLYVNEPNQKLLDKLKFLTNLKVGNPQVKFAGIMSYASLVSETYSRGDTSEKFMTKIFKKYYTNFLNSRKYEEQLTYLLGLINMAPTFHKELILLIITDNGLNKNLRTLAILGFKEYLVHDVDEDVFFQLWSIAQNSSEHFDIRVSTLDLLLSSNLTETHFNTIVSAYDKKPKNPIEEHITNYVFTTLQTLENSTGYSDYLSDIATARLQKGNIPHFSTSWTTGNYRLSFTDDEASFGVSLQTRLIGTPISNGLNIIHFSFNHFEMSLKMESYVFYIKLGGVYETIYESFLNSKKSSIESPVSALIDLIKKYGCKMRRGEDIHVDLAVFTEGRAVFGLHLNKENIDSYSNNPLFLDFMKLLIFYQSVSFPLIDYNTIPSEIGTDITVIEETRQIIYQESDNFEQIFDDEIELKELAYHHKSFRKYSSVIECNNPLAKVKTMVYKYQTKQNSFDFPFKVNSTSMTLSWTPKNDTARGSLINSLGTGIGEEYEDNFTHYCSDCVKYLEIPMGDPVMKTFESQELGLTIYFSKSKESEEQKQLNEMEPARKSPLLAIQSTHRSNSFVFPPAKPILYLLHYFYHLKTIHELYSVNFRIDPAFPGIQYESVLDFDINVDLSTNSNDPLDGAKFEFKLKLENKYLDGKVFSGFNTTFKSEMTTNSIDDSKSHVEQNIAFYMDLFNNYKEGVFHKVCVDGKTLYPSKRSDKLSLKPINSTTRKTIIAWGKVPSLSKCPENHIKLIENYLATEIQNRRAEESEEFKKCKEDSKVLKYVPPTESCIKAHEALSKYDLYGLYIDLKQAENLKKLERRMEKTKLGYKVLEYNNLGEGHINISITHVLGDLKLIDPKLLNYEERSAFYEFVTVDPTAVAYDDYDIWAGISGTCEITPTKLKPFIGSRQSVFQDSQEVTAFVECIDEPKAGLTVQKIDNKTVGFNFWSGNNVLQATSGKLTLNSERLNQTPENQDEDLRIYFLEDDVIYIVDPKVEIYYTTEYISIKAMNIYNKFICGECTFRNK